IDQESMEEFEVIPLEHASALELVRITEGLQVSSPEENASKRVRMIADERTNTVVLLGDPQKRLAYRAMIRQLDVVGDEGNTQVHYLRYAKAEDVAEVLRGIAEGRDVENGSTGSTSSSSSGSSSGSYGYGNQSSQVRIQAHESTNSVVIYGPAELTREMSQIIRQLDIRRAQVLVEAVIAEVSYD